MGKFDCDPENAPEGTQGQQDEGTRGSYYIRPGAPEGVRMLFTEIFEELGGKPVSEEEMAAKIGDRFAAAVAEARWEIETQGRGDGVAASDKRSLSGRVRFDPHSRARTGARHRKVRGRFPSKARPLT